jgi:hypothetical protein
MRSGIASITIIMALAGCSVTGPVRTLAITHIAEPCSMPDATWTSVYVDQDSGSCGWKRNAECYVQTPVETKYSIVGAAVRACLKA